MPLLQESVDYMAELIAAGPFSTEGERRAAKVLQRLPDTWTVISNKMLPSRDHSDEIDFIIIGTHWIFLLDEKSWYGKIVGNDQLWVLNGGFSTRSPLAKADFVAKKLAGHLKWKVIPLKECGFFIRSGVLFSSLDYIPQIHDSRATHGLFLLEQVCERLQVLDQQGGTPLIGQFRSAIIKALIDLSNRPQVPERIGVFTIEDAVALRPGVRLFHARREDSGQPRQLMVYDLSKDPLEAQELRNFYLHESTALQKLYSTGLVTQVQDPFPWSDDFLVLPLVPPQGKSLSAYPLPETRDEFMQELALTAACFKALEQIHAHNVLHRAIGPDTIYIQSSTMQKIIFTNFYAARVGTQTISSSLDQLAFEDPYAHIDLAIGYGYATPQTDVFSLGLVFLERLSGVGLVNIRATVESDIIFPDRQRWASFLPPELSTELAQIFQQFVSQKRGAVLPTAQEIASRLQSLLQRFKATTNDDSVEGRILDERYKVHRVLGRGAMARTYLASDVDFTSLDLFALKQYFNPEEVLPQAQAEFNTMRKMQSSYLPRAFDIYSPKNDVHLKMEYVPGQTLQQLETEFPWPLEQWWTFAQDLLKAVEALEQQQLLHRDIKPANIILHETDNRPVLIDFGFAIKQGIPGQAAGTPLYLPPETFSSSSTATPPPSSDRYSVGVILFKALLGYLPFTFDNTKHRQLVSTEKIADAKTRRLATILLRVVAENPAQRFSSIQEMRHELQTAWLALEEQVPIHELQEQINAWVKEVGSLYRNSDSGNMNNRGLDSDFVHETYVQTALDTQLLPAILEKRPKLVFLSGNPGDGKTAFLEQVQQALQQKGAQQFKEPDPSGWEWEWNGHIFRSCYDASESNGDLSADQQLAEKLQGLEGSNTPAAAVTVLIAINDGRLADYFTVRNPDRFAWIAKQIEQARDTSQPEHLAVWVIDLKKRAFVNLPHNKEKSVFRQVLQRLVAADRWKICEKCAAQTVCPIRNNALALRDAKNVQHLEYLFLLSHLRRQRHTTMRDLRSALAYLITGNKSCEQIHATRREEAGASLIDFAYWQSAFAPVEKHDELLLDLMPLDPARFPHPHLDRFLHFHQTLKDADTRSRLFADKSDLPLQRFKDEHAWISAFKRRLYFESAKKAEQDGDSSFLPRVRWQRLLPYQHANTFVDLLEDSFEDDQLNMLREKLALGIVRSDSIMEEVPAGKLSVKVSASQEQQLVILKQLPLEDFALIVDFPPETAIVERLPEMIFLRHKSGTPRLEITLDLFELLLKMAFGLQPTAPEFKPLLEDLKLFKDTLLLRETRDLVLIESQQRTHLVTQRAGKIIRTRL